MIITENVNINGRQCNRKYSDEGYYIMRDNINFIVAIDLAELNREYVETDIKIYEEEATEEDYLKALAKLGVE